MPNPEISKRRRTWGVHVFAVDTQDLPPFKPTLLSIVKMAFTAGLQALSSRGQTLEAIRKDRIARDRFLRGCHRGYDKAQQRIGAEVLALQQHIEAAERELARLRQLKDPNRVKTYDRITVLRNRQLALRRIIDAVLHVITNFDTWILRRLLLEDRPHDIDKKVLQKTLDVAERRNGANRLRFSLVADLSTIVQIGDLVEISFDSGGRRWKVIELKEGRINEILSGMLGSAEADGPEIERRVETTLGKEALKQARRMRRQMHRLSEFHRIITTDRGSDPRTNVPIVITGDRFLTENYLDAIGRIVRSARTTGFGAASIPGGIHLVALRRDRVARDYIGAVNHVFFHMRYPDRACTLNEGGNRTLEELHDMGDGSVFVDLVAHSMHAQWGTPVYFWLKPDETPDLVVGDVRIFAQFDANAFFALAAKEGIQLSWVTGRQAEILKKERVSREIPGSPGAWGINAVLPDGSKQTLLAGFIARAIADLTTPRQLIDSIKMHPEQMRKAGIDPFEFGDVA